VGGLGAGTQTGSWYVGCLKEDEDLGVGCVVSPVLVRGEGADVWMYERVQCVPCVILGGMPDALHVSELPLVPGGVGDADAFGSWW
jgi:hypothetical protein